MFSRWGMRDTYSVRVFSDSILFACPIENDVESLNFIEGIDEFSFIFTELQSLQLQLVNEGYFLRGAISVDELFMDDVIIYGMGIIDSYEAENKAAKYPRIILTETARFLLEEIVEKSDVLYNDNKIMRDLNRRNYLEHYARKDDDDLYFVNYLEVINIGDYPFLDELEKHKQMVEDRLNQYRDNPCVLQKYQWVAKYHNSFCNQHGHSGHMIEFNSLTLKPKVYIETSVPSYLTAWRSRDLVVAGNQETTKDWWNRRYDFDLYISEFVLQEVSSGDFNAAADRLKSLDGIPEIEITEEVAVIAEKLLADASLPSKARIDALHIATAAVGGMDYLLTWNCAHIANPALRLKIESVIRSFGYEPPIICTPQELLEA
jgi:hypothetical protein